MRFSTSLVMSALLMAGAPAITAAAQPSEPAVAAQAGADSISAPRVERWAGPDRYETAARTSLSAFPAGADTVYVATGRDYPDALTVGGVAATAGAPLLLVGSTGVPDATMDELQRLAPEEVVIVGGTAAVPAETAAAIASATGVTPRRLQGTTRYETAAAISAAAHAPGVDVAYVATGTNFPDALAGGPLAAATGGPILLVTTTTVPEATTAELERLTPGRIVALGGSVAIADGVLDALGAHTSGTVTRLAGTDRTLTAIDVAKAAYPDGTDQVFLATGWDFPDALAGTPATAAVNAPVLLTRKDCMPQPVIDEIVRLGATTMTVLGGAVALTDEAAALIPCGTDGSIPMPTVSVGDVTPSQDVLPDPDGGPDRPLGAMTGANQSEATTLVHGELVVVGDDAVLDRSLAVTGGTLLETADGGPVPVHRIAVDTTDVDTSTLPDLLRALNPAATGSLTVSDEAVLALVALAAELSVEGIPAGVNFVPAGGDLANGEIAEAPAGWRSGDTSNPATWDYMNGTEAPFTGVVEAWRALAGARLTIPNFVAAGRIKIGVTDGGFFETGDYPPGTTGITNVENAATCTDDFECPWHGTGTSHTAAGLVDDGFGTAGVAGPVATIAAGGWTGDVFGTLAHVVSAIDAPVINMSWSMNVEDGWFFLVEPLNLVVSATVDTTGKIVVASAGNETTDIDGIHCPFGCWEHTYVLPCEFAAVICVGALEGSGGAREYPAGYSNYGTAPADDGGTVNIWAPGHVYFGPDGDNPGNTVRYESGGTSNAAPFVAGAVALIKAADPGLSRSQVINLLYATARPGQQRPVASGEPRRSARRYVDAYTAVTTALGNRPAELFVDSPTEGLTTPRGRNLSLSARTPDPDGGNAPITWRFDGDVVSTERDATIHIDPFVASGEHIVTATITDGPYRFTEIRHFFVEDTPATGEILGPDDEAEIYASQSVLLEGQIYDPDEPGGVPHDDNIRWFIHGEEADGDFRGLTAGPVRFGDYTNPGPGRYVQVNLQSRPNGGEWEQIEQHIVRVLEDPADIPPDVNITSPPDGYNASTSELQGPDSSGYYIDQEFTASASDPEGDSDVSINWSAAWTGGSEPPASAAYLGPSSGPTVTIRLYVGNCATTWTVTATATEDDGPTNSDANTYTVNSLC